MEFEIAGPAEQLFNKGFFFSLSNLKTCSMIYKEQLKTDVHSWSHKNTASVLLRIHCKYKIGHKSGRP